MNLASISATDIAAWSGLIVAVIGAIGGVIVKIISAQADREKQRAIAENSKDIAGLKAGHDGNSDAIKNLNSAVQGHDAQITAVATAIPVKIETPKVEP